MNLNRRSFLRSHTALIALPFLESLGFLRFASAAAPPSPPKRLVFLSFGWGVTKETWFPDTETTGKDWELPPGLSPLARHRDQITVIQGLQNQYVKEAHWGSTFYLTGANRYGEPGVSFHNTISADQVAAGHLGKETRFASLQLDCGQASQSGHGPGLSLAWDKEGKPVAGLSTPLEVYRKLFAAPELDPEAHREMLKRRRSLLDSLLTDTHRLNRKLGRRDQEKLDEYLEGIRTIETRIEREASWIDRPVQKPEQIPAIPEGPVAGYEEIRLMYDLLVAALQTDSTRVITYRQPVEQLLRSLGSSVTGHSMSHYGPGIRRETSELRDRKQSELLAYLLDRLAETPMGDGSALLDHVALSYGSNIETVHDLRNCPTVLAGGGAGIEHGHHLVAPSGTPLCNLWLQLLQRTGVPVDRHGDSSEALKNLPLL